MTLENIRSEQRDAILFLTFDRPKVLNALNQATIAELQSVFAAVRTDDSIRAVIITGAGDKAFVAGADISELAQADSRNGKDLAQRGQAAFTAMEECGKPVIAAINGFALGGGCELALACTLRIASENAKLGQPEVKLGLVAGYGGTQRLPRLVGKGAALQLLLTGEIISAQEALRIGLVNEVVPAERLMPRAEEIARAIAAVAPIAVRHTLEAVHHGYDQALSDGLFLEASLFGLCCATDDKAEGTRAFLEKRPATWKGR
ncbi:MAG TPA: enoyl-CoA hydratase-related protein [Acidobacteriaceae bacterium]|nr:enoyl-CoA hydratase-related protein [Acidobacteriaceae bacterium]